VQKGSSDDWVKNFELLSGGNVREVNINEQFSVTRVECEHQIKTTNITTSAVGLLFIF